jgi:hypothetical protein
VFEDAQEVSPQVTRSLLIDDPFGLMAYLMDIHLSPTVDATLADGNSPTSWTNQFQHRLLILIARLGADLSLPPQDIDTDSLEFTRVLQHLMLACGKTVPTSLQSQLGGPFTSGLLGTLLQMAGVELVKVR